MQRLKPSELQEALYDKVVWAREILQAVTIVDKDLLDEYLTWLARTDAVLRLHDRKFTVGVFNEKN